MPGSAFPYKLYLVVSAAACRHHFLTVVEEAILGGVDIVQLREKDLSTKDYLSRALQIKVITDRYKIPLVINDSLEVAQKANAFGIHVGNEDIAPTQIRDRWKECPFIGYSIEYLAQLQHKESEAADYLGISPVFSTPTKSNTVTEWGLEGIARIRQGTHKPLVAIGGMNLSNVTEVIKAGADCIAVVSAICAADDPRKAAYRLKNTILQS
ncbi:MAG TPA: thiamine phosphate synthase [Chitinophagaceae bacterium]|nr:thiamine phosphate synthase [Chitinophagaceae bacterium]